MFAATDKCLCKVHVLELQVYGTAENVLRRPDKRTLLLLLQLQPCTSWEQVNTLPLLHLQKRAFQTDKLRVHCSCCSAASVHFARTTFYFYRSLPQLSVSSSEASETRGEHLSVQI